jgi:hypothetical protein
VELTFINQELKQLCSGQDDLHACFGDDAAALEQLLYELDCADTLGRIEELPHVLLRRAPQGRVGAHGADEAGVLLKPEPTKSKAFRDADGAIIVAVAVGHEHFNPEGAAWPRASATSPTMQ